MPSLRQLISPEWSIDHLIIFSVNISCKVKFFVYWTPSQRIIICTLTPKNAKFGSEIPFVLRSTCKFKHLGLNPAWHPVLRLGLSKNKETFTQRKQLDKSSEDYMKDSQLWHQKNSSHVFKSVSFLTIHISLQYRLDRCLNLSLILNSHFF